MSHSARSAARLRAAAIQLAVGPNVAENIVRAGKLIDLAASEGARFVALPECFTGKYGVEHFATYAESVPADSTCADRAGSGGAAMMAGRARRHGITVTGGVIERAADGVTLFNAMPIYSSDGTLASTYRKVHLSRVLGITSEADVLTAGEPNVTIRCAVDGEQAPAGGAAAAADPLLVGMACCFDLRFPRWLARYGPRRVEDGPPPVDVLCAPSAFLDVTGGPHWELLLRRTALDGQCFVVAPNVAHNEADALPLHGRSMIVDPWGSVLASCAQAGDQIVYADLEAVRVDEVRAKLPLARWDE